MSDKPNVTVLTIRTGLGPVHYISVEVYVDAANAASMYIQYTRTNMFTPPCKMLLMYH